MVPGLHTSLRALREERGWSQSELGEMARITRQSLASIEAGRATPSTEVALRLARALGVSVEDLFQLIDGDLDGDVVEGAGLGSPLPGRVRVATLAGRRIAYGIGSDSNGHGLAQAVGEVRSDGRVRLRAFASPPPAPDLVVAGCDPSFGLVRERLARDHGVETLWLSAGSRSALGALARGEVHAAGIHLKDTETGRYNEPLVRRTVPFPTTRISISTWEQVLLFPSGNPSGLQGPADLARPGIRFVNREPGSGSRTLIELQLEQLGIPESEVPGFLETSARGHEAVGMAVESGTANAGVAIRAVGVARGLGMIMLAEEPYELVIPDHFLELPPVQALLRTLRSRELRRQVESLGGYDASSMGRPV
jgi:putative molybdopterin biosynthesis protein